MPKRLLDLGPASAIRSPVLIDTSESPPQLIHGENKVNYACLSYCWGSNSLPLRTTSQTVAEHKKGIPVENLPQAFKDAIFVARALGIQYLWIDALCILQDDDLDWEQESARMSDIFHHSTITFGAASSSSCDETFLRRRRDNSLELAFRSSVNPKASGKYSISLSVEKPWIAEQDASIWNTRGWVWQEQYIAPRLLIFGAEMIHMRCHGYYTSENGCHGPETKCRGAEKPPDIFESSIVEDWIYWMMEYSGREFTHAYDKLSAVSGMARSLQIVAEKAKQFPIYLAGLWLHKDFHMDLRWVPVDPKISFRRMINTLKDAENYCAPSWSWASRDQGCLSLLPSGNLGLDEEFEVAHYNMMPMKSDAMMRTKSGSSITFRGKLIRTPCRPSDGIAVPNSDQMLGYANKWEVSWPNGTIRYYLDWDPRLGHEGDPESLLHLFITSGTDGLVLYPAGSEHGTRFLRVGAFDLNKISTARWPIREFSII